MDEDYGKLRVTAVLRNGRCRYDPISKARLVEACLEPGASVARLALDNGVNANLLRKWVKQRKDRGAIALGSTSTSAFIPVRVDNTEQDLRRARELCASELSMPCNAKDRLSGDHQRRFPSPATLQACLPNGVKLSLGCGDVETLTAVIGVLGNVQTGR